MAASNDNAARDELAFRPDAEREAAVFSALRTIVAHARAHAPWWAEALAAVDPDSLTDRTALAGLPVLRKSDLIDMQASSPPFAGLTTGEVGALKRLYLSPGPIAEPEGHVEGPGTHWRMERAMSAAGFRAGDRVANCFSYHMTPAGMMFDAACAALGCAVLPAGVGQTEMQVEAFRRFSINGYVGTPDFLRVILDKANELATPITSVEKALVTAGPLFPSLREAYGAAGISVRQCYGTAELGLVAYETEDPAHGLAIDEGCIVEIVRPGTGDPVPDGEVGEVVVTTFDPHYPLIRFATGDLSAVIADPKDGRGRTARRLRGWLGRADQTTKVRGQFVHPRQVAAVGKAVPEVTKARLEVDEDGGRDRMTILCEVETPGDPHLAGRIEEAVRASTGLRAEVRLVAPGALPNDGKVIDDRRTAG